MRKKIQFDKDELYDMYIGKEMSTYEIAEDKGCTYRTVANRLNEFGIPCRGRGRTALKFDKNTLIDMYINKQMSSYEIAIELNCNNLTIIKRLVGYGITIRTLKEASILTWKNPEYREKNVRAIRKGLGSTPNIPEQRFIDLCEKHNMPYKYVGNGQVIIGGRNPDFIDVNGEKVVIEIFGRVYHDPSNTFLDNIPHQKTFEGTMEHYKEYGFTCIIVWEDEFNDIDTLLKRFNYL